MALRITKRIVDAATAGDRDRYVWDSDFTGFGVKVTPAGRKVYLVQYRLGGRSGRTRRVTIGTHGKITAEIARTEAKRILGEVAGGRDPAAERQRRSGTPTVAQAMDRFLAEHVDAKRKPRTAAEYRRIAKLHILPRFAKRLVPEIVRTDIGKLHREMKAVPYQANRTLALLSKFFNWCEQQAFRPDGTNPCRHVEKYAEQKRERFLSAKELSNLGNALDEEERHQTSSPWIIAAIRLLILSGARLNEILTLKWEHVDFDNAVLRLTDSKTGAKVIYLSPLATETLQSIPRIEGNPFVICGHKTGTHLVNLEKPWRRIRATASLNDVRLHDLRHSFASVAASGGLSLPIIGALLGHSQPQTTARYAHLASDPLRQAVNRISDEIASAMARAR